MKTKLTLSVEKDLVHYARQHARKKGQSVSGMFSSFLLAQKSRAGRKDVPKISAMVGTLKQYYIDGSKEAVRSAYAKKHSN